jgi:hypothetical protein
MLPKSEMQEALRRIHPGKFARRGDKQMLTHELVATANSHSSFSQGLPDAISAS